MALQDPEYLGIPFSLSEKVHFYGPNVHLLNDPFHQRILAASSTEAIGPPKINHYIRWLYQFLMVQAVNQIFPRKREWITTRMSSLHQEACFEQELVYAPPRIVVVNMLRAGLVPSFVCYELLQEVFPHSEIRHDHIMLNRATNEKGAVVGVKIAGAKIGGSVEGATVFFPDPMGATGHSVTSMMDLYDRQASTGLSKGVQQFVALHLIVTPEYLKKLQPHSDRLHIFALRLDRGLSPSSVLQTSLGTHWEKEKGLNEKDYIVPGAGGMGEILSNSRE